MLNDAGETEKWAGINIDIDARKRAEAALRESEERRDLALEATQLGRFVWHVQEDRSESDARTLALFDQPPDSRISHREALASMIHPEDRASYAAAVAAATRPEGARRLETDIRVRRADGSWRWLEIRGRVSFDQNGQPLRMAGTALDITGRKAIEISQQDSERHQTFLLQLSDALRPLTDADQIMRAATRTLGQALGANRVFYANIDEDGDTAYVASVFADRIEEAAGSYSLTAFAPHYVAEWRAGKVTITRDVAADPRFTPAQREAYATVSARAAVGAPLVKGGRLVAMLGVNSAGPREWNEAEVSLIKETAERTWAAVERARAEAALAESKERQAFLLKLSDALRLLADSVEIMTTASTLTGPHLGLDRCFYGEVDPASEHVYLANSYCAPGVPPFPQRVQLDEFSEEFVDLIATGTTLVVDDTRNDPRVADSGRSRYLAAQIEACVGVPLVKGGRLVAILSAHQSSARQWTNNDVVLLEEVAERTWAAVERARAEEALRKSEQRFQSIASAVDGVFYMTELTPRRLVYLSPGYERIWGRPRDELLEDLSLFEESIHPDDRPLVRAGSDRQINGEAVYSEYRILRPDGTVRWIADRALPVPGKPGLSAGLATDITDRKQIEIMLRESERFSRALVEGVPQLVWRASTPGFWTWASPQWTEFTGQSEADSYGWGWLDPVHLEDRVRAREMWSSAAGRGEFQAEYRIWYAEERRYRWFQTRAKPVRDEKGNIVEWLGTSTDVDHLRRLQELQRTLLAELQHRVRNILGVIRSMTRRSSEHQHSLDEYVRHLEGRLGTLARTQVLLTRSVDTRVDLEYLVRDELVAQATDEERVTLSGPEIQLGPKVAEVFSLAIHELTTNSVKYGALSRPSATLRIEWSVEERNDERWLKLTWSEAGVAVADIAPRHSGFGTELITRRVPYELKGNGTIDMRPGGIKCMLEFPLSEQASILQTDTSQRNTGD